MKSSVFSPAVAVVFVSLWQPAPAAIKQAELPRAEELVVAGTNEFRAARGLPALKKNRELDEAARAYAAFMAQAGKLDHEADGSTPSARAKRHGYDYCVVAENIARQYSSRGFATEELAGDLVEGWKRSPGHRKNMLDAEVVDIGVAIGHRTFKGMPDYYAVQLFGRPRSASIQFRISNETGASVKYRVGDRPYTLAPRYSRTHTECAPRRLDFGLNPGADFVADDGARFTVTSTRGNLSVRRE